MKIKEAKNTALIVGTCSLVFNHYFLPKTGTRFSSITVDNPLAKNVLAATLALSTPLAWRIQKRYQERRVYREKTDLFSNVRLFDLFSIITPVFLTALIATPIIKTFTPIQISRLNCAAIAYDNLCFSIFSGISALYIKKKVCSHLPAINKMSSDLISQNTEVLGTICLIFHHVLIHDFRNRFSWITADHFLAKGVISTLFALSYALIKEADEIHFKVAEQFEPLRTRKQRSFKEEYKGFSFYFALATLTTTLMAPTLTKKTTSYQVSILTSFSMSLTNSVIGLTALYFQR